jgi:hypothetical protein
VSNAATIGAVTNSSVRLACRGEVKRSTPVLRDQPRPQRGDDAGFGIGWRWCGLGVDAFEGVVGSDEGQQFFAPMDGSAAQSRAAETLRMVISAFCRRICLRAF